MKNYRGITIIALIITIIVLLILAGISIGMITGENGILNKAKLSKEQTNAGQIEEENRLGKYNEMIDNYTTRSGTVSISEDQYNSLLSRLDALEKQSGIIESGTSADGLSKYVKYSNGLKMAWGTTVAADWTNSTSRTYNLPITFSDTSYVLTLTKRNAVTNWAQVGYRLNVASTSTFAVSSYSYTGTYTATGQTLQWTAVGY